MRTDLENHLIEKYGEIFSDYWDKSNPIEPMVFGIECDDGWYHILDSVLFEIREYALKRFPLGFTVKQIKEKFGRLEIYLSHSDEYLNELTLAASEESFKTCEVCGTKENIGMTKGWYKSFCKDCYDVSWLKIRGYQWYSESIYKNFEKK